MTAPLQPATTLLTLADPQRGAGEVDAVDDGFADELDHATEQADSPRPADDDPRPEESESGSTEPQETEENTAPTRDSEASEPDEPLEAEVRSDLEALVTALVSEPLAPQNEGADSAALAHELQADLESAIEGSLAGTGVTETADSAATGDGVETQEEAAALTQTQSGLPPEETAEGSPTHGDFEIASDQSTDPAAGAADEATASTTVALAEPTHEALGVGVGQSSAPSNTPETSIAQVEPTTPEAATPVNPAEPSDNSQEEPQDRRPPTPPAEAAKPSDAAVTGTDRPTTETTGPPAVSDASSTTRTEGPAAAEAPTPAPTVDASRFVTRVTRAIDFANERGGGPIEMRLSPPELGSLQVKIELKEGVMTAALEVENPTARQTLLENLPALRDRLEQQQVRIDKFEVDVRDDSQQRDSQPQQDGQTEQRPGERRESDSRTSTQGPNTDPDAPVEATIDRPTATIDFGNDTINLVA